MRKIDQAFAGRLMSCRWFTFLAVFVLGISTLGVRKARAFGGESGTDPRTMDEGGGGGGGDGDYVVVELSRDDPVGDVNWGTMTDCHMEVQYGTGGRMYDESLNTVGESLDVVYNAFGLDDPVATTDFGGVDFDDYDGWWVCYWHDFDYETSMFEWYQTWLVNDYGSDHTCNTDDINIYGGYSTRN